MIVDIDLKALDGGRRLPFVEDFYTIQGEGRYTGHAAYFIRVAGCDVGCPWCDAKYTWNLAQFPPVDIETVLERVGRSGARLAVVTGGEPTLYPLGPLTARLHEMGLKVNLETAGTHPVDGDFDWVCLSPKHRNHPVAAAFERADELKVVVGCEEDLRWAEENAARVRPGCLKLMQPEWNARETAMPLIVEYVKAHPEWQVSIQTHKYMQIP